VEQRVAPKEAEPKAKGRPERPQGIPADNNVRPENRVQEEERGKRR
jgi:hypothetical protein